MTRGPYQFSRTDYLGILSNDVKWRTKRPQKIGIIGAGISGLVAGWLLGRAGHEVEIFEANKVVGGRIKTLREGFSSGLYAEAGAMRVSKSHSLTNYLATELFGLGVEDFINECPNTVIMVNDNLVSRKEYYSRPTLLKFDITKKEERFTAQQLFDSALIGYIRRLDGFKDYDIRDFLKDNSQADRELQRHLISELDRHSLRTFFNEEACLGRHKLSPGAVEMICTVMGLEMQMPMSLAELVHDHSKLHEGDSTHSFIGGMDMLPKSFVKLGNGPPKRQFNLNVHYSTRVTMIRSVPGDAGLRLYFENTHTHHENNRAFNRLIIAIPFSALRHVKMPALQSRAKTRAIRQLHYENSCKTCLEFSERFWAKEHQSRSIPGAQAITGGSSVTDMPTRQIIYPSAKSLFSKRGGILVSYTWGDDSLRWTALQKPDRIRRVFNEINRVHNREDSSGIPLLNDWFVGGVSHSWAEDEFTSGAFATFEPYQMTELFESIWKPDGTIHYCGEHTSLKHGWIEGAVESAVRVSAEVMEQVG